MQSSKPFVTQILLKPSGDNTVVFASKFMDINTQNTHYLVSKTALGNMKSHHKLYFLLRFFSFGMKVKILYNISAYGVKYKTFSIIRRHIEYFFHLQTITPKCSTSSV